MTYIDTWVREAHDAVGGESVETSLLEVVSQVHRDAEAGRLFERITGIGVGSKAQLIELMRRVKEDGYNLSAALHDTRLLTYVMRQSPFLA